MRSIVGWDIAAIDPRVADTQADCVAAAMDAVRRRHPTLRLAVVTGLGEFIAVRAAVALLCAAAELSPV